MNSLDRGAQILLSNRPPLPLLSNRPPLPLRFNGSDYRAPPPTPATLPVALTRPKRPMAATNAAIQNSMQQLAATTRLGVKKKIYPN